jgi:hypothetical protein
MLNLVWPFSNIEIELAEGLYIREHPSFAMSINTEIIALPS